MAEYIDNTRKAKKTEVAVSDDEESPKKPEKMMITGVIDAIHTVTRREGLTKKVLQVSIKKA